MSNPTKSLAARISWESILQVLDVDLTGSACIPRIVTCPSCAEPELSVTSDHVLGGEWFHCRSCGFAGDAIELAAATWKIDVDAAVNQLENMGLFPDPLGDDEVKAYVRDHVRMRRRFVDFWEQARQEPLGGSACNGQLLRQFSLRDSWQDGWLDKGGQFFGVASRTELEELFAPDSYATQERPNRNGRTSKRRGPGPGPQRLFEGHGWDRLIVVPHYDLPGRICGLLMVGRDGDPDAGDFVYKRVNLGPSSKTPREAGLGMLTSLDFDGHKLFGDDVIVISDPLVGMKLQGKQLIDSRRPLPIVLLHSSRDHKLLQLPPSLLGRRLIFWGPMPKMLPIAKQHGGCVSDFVISDTELDYNLKHRSPADWLRMARQQAIPWVSALRLQMAKLDDMRARHLLDQLELTPEESRCLAHGLGNDEGDRFTRCEPFRLALRTVQVRGREITESVSGWKLPNGESICDLPIRVEAVLTTENGDSHYRIAVQDGSKQSRFTIPEPTLKRDGLFVAVFYELKRETGQLLNYQRRWNKDALFIATSLSPPRTIVGSERIGWQNEPLRFQFPYYSILNTGDVTNEPVPLVIEEDELPASHLNPPGNTSRTDISALSETTPGTQIVWALAACICRNLLAENGMPAPNGIILDGEFAHEAGVTAARSLGCAEVDVNLRRGSTTILDAILDAASRHGWPAIVKFKQRPQHRITSRWLDSPELRNAMLPLDRYAALAVSSHEGFIRVWVPDAAQPLGQLRRAAAWVIPNYLQNLCRRKKWIDELGGPKVIDVLHDIAGWFEGVAGNSASIVNAESALFIDSLQPATAFARLVTLMHHEGDITFARAGWDVEQPSVKPATIVYQDATNDQPAVVGVRPQDVNTVLAQRRAPAINLHTVERHLKDADAWVASAVEQQGQVWLIDAGWWDENSKELDGTPDSFDRRHEGAPLLSPT